MSSFKALKHVLVEDTKGFMSPKKFAGHLKKRALGQQLNLTHPSYWEIIRCLKINLNIISVALFVSKSNTANHVHPYNNLHDIAGPSKNNIKLLHR